MLRWLLVLAHVSFWGGVSMAAAASEDTLATDQGPIGISWVSDRSTGYNSLGKPHNVTNINSELPQSFLVDVYTRLPNGRRVDPSYIDQASKGNLVVDSDFTGEMTVSVTFLNEGAGYRNAFGYFLYDPDAPPATFTDIADHKLIFPNASKWSGGQLLQGDTVPMDVTLTGGQAMGFFVISNGYGWGSGSNNAELQSIGPHGQPFYSLADLNPEPAELSQHNVVFYDESTELLVIGFEDLDRRNADNDFNDILFTIDATPVAALVGVDETGAVEEGGYDPLVEPPGPPPTSTTFYPSSSGYATLMFEDLWPSMGDYDFNDLVVRYRMAISKDDEDAVQSVEMTYQIQAVGAAFHNGFALHLPNVQQSNVKSALLSFGDEVTALTPEVGPSETVFILSADVWDDVADDCPMFRTVASCMTEITEPFTFTVEFNDAVSETSLGLPPYDPFIFVAADHPRAGYAPREWEVHLKDFSGTSVFNASLLGDLDDASNSENSFVNANNMPWALNIGDEIAHASELTDIQLAYPDFEQWASSSGAQKSDWYKAENGVPAKIIGGGN